MPIKILHRLIFQEFKVYFNFPEIYYNIILSQLTPGIAITVDIRRKIGLAPQNWTTLGLL